MSKKSKNPVANQSRLPIHKLESTDIASVLKEMISAKKEYEITKETEWTKREEIRSNLTVRMKQLSDRREIITEILQKEYSIRQDALDKMFGFMETAYQDGNTEVVVQAMRSVEGVIKNSPLKDLIAIGRALEGDGELIL